MTQIIQENSRRVNQIIESVLQLSRREEAQRKELELSGWMTKFIDEFRDSHDIKTDDLQYEATSNKLDVEFDPTHLHQILWNLCENSMRYGKPDENTAATVRVFISRDAVTNSIFVDIKDNGPGIPHDLNDTIFEPFYTSHTQGTGLGLYICKELAELNKCRLQSIRVQSGACFRLNFATT